MKEAHGFTDILKEEWSGVRSTLIMTDLKSILLTRLLLNERVNVKKRWIKPSEQNITLKNILKC